MGNVSNLNKYNAYVEIMADYSSALEVLRDKKLAYGETAVVSFYNDEGGPEPSIEMLIGIGMLDGGLMVTDSIGKKDVMQAVPTQK